MNKLIPSLNYKYFYMFLLIGCLSFSLIMVPASAIDLLKTDFQEESFAKTIDYFDYVRAWALLHGFPKPSDTWHANVYVTYVNKTGLQMLYMGLHNISLADRVFLTIPIQSLILHYKTEHNNRDVLVSSSFLMLMGFNDTSESIHEDSPDKNDDLWASFSFGVNLAEMFPNLNLPSFNSNSEIYPLTSSNDGLTWNWGMKYTNLTALWITTHITDDNETDTSKPWGLATYDELTFNYTLTIDPEHHQARISQDHVIGRMRNLWTFGGWFLFWPIYNHYNSTGCYRYGVKVSNETIYNFLQTNNVKMSIAEYQTSVMLDRNTTSTSSTGQNVTDNEVFVSDSTISTYTEDGEHIFDTDFGVKETYNLYNYTENPEETTSKAYNAITRTANISGYAKNQALFNYQRNFARYLPLTILHMYPKLLQRAKETITNMSKADYLFLISYPTYSGYRIEHDPIYTLYYAPSAISPTGSNLEGLVIVIAVSTLLVGSFVILKRRR